mmetsp:Transcript_76194/g.236717  ORF Transcript_76194/g.236717 Transcript_76194/m.236717 type:complete len:1079 (+) Transcript_76194:23-3259(+)
MAMGKVFYLQAPNGRAFHSVSPVGTTSTNAEEASCMPGAIDDDETRSVSSSDSESTPVAVAPPARSNSMPAPPKVSKNFLQMDTVIECIGQEGEAKTQARRKDEAHRISVSSKASSVTSAATSVASSSQPPDGTLRRQLSEIQHNWRHFSLFGINKEDKTPRVWGNRVKAVERRTSMDSATSAGSRRSWDLLKMMKHHPYHEEMRLQLRDERIRLSYLDAFEMDKAPESGAFLIRVFSFGATLLEYFKIVISVWTFVMSLTVVAFWEVLTLPTYMYVDLAVDTAFAICLLLQLRTSILEVETGREFCVTRRILRYTLTDVRFWMDVVSCVPLWVMDIITGRTSTMRWLALVKACRGWRITRTPPEHRFVPSARFLLLQLSGAILMGGHLLACIWYMLVYNQEHFWTIYMNSIENADFLDLYMVSLNQGVYLLLGVDRDARTALEHLFFTVCAPVGALVHAYMLGKIILLIQRVGALETKQNEHTMAIQEAMRILGLPPNLQMRIIAFFTYERIHRSSRLFNALFADLSPQLRFELQLHLYLDLVGKSGLFRKARPRMIREIIVGLEDVIFLPGDWVCRYGDYGDSMYFMIRGTCAVIAEDTVTELKTLSRGAYFGEVALLTGVPRTAYVRANTFCIMAQLTKDGFAPIVRKWPEEIDVLISGINNHNDREKIKAEASRLYGLRRPSNLSDLGRASTHVRVHKNLLSRKDSVISNTSLFDDERQYSELDFDPSNEEPRLIPSPAANALQQMLHLKGDEPREITKSPMLRSSKSGGLVVPRVHQQNKREMASRFAKRRISWSSDCLDHLTKQKVEPFGRRSPWNEHVMPSIPAQAATTHEEEEDEVWCDPSKADSCSAPPRSPHAGSPAPHTQDRQKDEAPAKSEQQSAELPNVVHVRSAGSSSNRSPGSNQGHHARIADDAEFVNTDGEDTLEVAAKLVSEKEAAETKSTLMRRRSMEAALGRRRVTSPSERRREVQEQNELLSKVQAQVSDLTTHVTRLEQEVASNRQAITTGLLELRRWLSDDLKDTLVREVVVNVMQLQVEHCQGDASLRAHGDGTNSFDFPEADALGAGISTPFV